MPLPSAPGNIFVYLSHSQHLSLFYGNKSHNFQLLHNTFLCHSKSCFFSSKLLLFVYFICTYLCTYSCTICSTQSHHSTALYGKSWCVILLPGDTSSFWLAFLLLALALFGVYHNDLKNSMCYLKSHVKIIGTFNWFYFSTFYILKIFKHTGKLKNNIPNTFRFSSYPFAIFASSMYFFFFPEPLKWVVGNVTLQPTYFSL